MNVEWTHEPETFSSLIGEVYFSTPSSMWHARLQIGDKVYKLNAAYDSAPIAMSAVERTYKREMEKLQVVEPTMPKFVPPKEY